MALVVETGQAGADSESYCSVAFATAYHAARGNAAWAALASDDVREAALRNATDYMEQVYRLQWKGYRFTEAQALSWPREEVQRQDYTFLNQYSFYPTDSVPVEVKNSCASLALRAATGELAPDIDRASTREKVGPIEVEYDKNAPLYVRFRAVDNLLAPFLKTVAGGASRMLVRV
jgi:hypothetical protein